MMKAQVLKNIGPVDQNPLAVTTLPIPEPKDQELRIKVSVCGVCRTDLHIVEGDLPEKIVVLSQKLLQELQDADIADYHLEPIKSLAGNELPGKTKFRRPHTSNELRKNVTLTIGREMKAMFGFRHTKKGRPYPDVVSDLVQLALVDTNIRQVNRDLSELDEPETLPYDRSS